MRHRSIVVVGLVALCAAVGCGDDDVVERDTGINRDGSVDLGRPEVDMGDDDDASTPPPPPVDMGPPPEDAGPPDLGPPDAGPSEPCDRPGANEELVCGMCGTQSRFCTSARVWEYTPCEGEHGVCIAGTRGVEACGRCGTAPARCTDACVWEITGECAGEAGECDPGDVERTSTGCAMGSSRGRACNAMCAWGDYTECTARPTDFDGDGSPYGTDCDDRDPDVEPGTTASCGTFACGSVSGRIAYQTGTRTCVGPGWSLCERPMGCTEPTGTTLCDLDPFATETRDCATTGCPMGPGFQTRSCGFPGMGMWSDWGPCTASGGMCTFSPTDVIEETCGACGEGVRYTICDGSTCTASAGACIGRGCTPGTRTLSSSGCPAGQVRAQECTDACRLGPPGECGPGPTSVDVMFLFDVSGSHGMYMVAVRDALAAAVVEPLLEDGSTAVGVSYFSDYPLGMHGSPPDVPFGGLAEPTTNEALVTSALPGVTILAGGDGGEALIEALSILSGGDPHPTAMPLLECSPGRTSGGCWRSGSRPVIVVVSEEAHHDLPGADVIGVPDYSSAVTPPPPEWESVRDRLVELGASVVFLTPNGITTSPVPQFEAIAMELGQDPATAIVTYDVGTVGDGLTALLDAIRSLTP